MLIAIASVRDAVTWLRRIVADRPLLRPVVGFVRSRRGIAATEFALLLPVLILLYAGSGELAQAAMTGRRLEDLSRTLVDLVAQQPTAGQTLSTPAPANATLQADLQSILTAASALMSPSSLTTLTMTVSAVDITNNALGVCCVFKVRWSYTQSGTLRPCNVYLTPVPATQPPSPATVSQAMMPPLVGVPLQSPVPILIADVSYQISGVFSSSWLSFPVMQRTSYMLPRTTGQVIVAAPLQAGSNQSGAICY